MYESVKHFETLYNSVIGEFGFRVKTYDEFPKWQDSFRARLRGALGLDNMEADLKDHRPRGEMVSFEDMGGYTRESWHLWVEPTVPLPFYLLRPKSSGRKPPLVLTPHGHNHPHIYVGIAHNEDEEKSIKEGDRDIAIQAVGEGYMTIAPTTRAFGETRTERDREDDKPNSCRIQLLHGLLVGRTPIGERVWDMSCLIDWAIAELDIDANRIAITGNSGGGTISLFAAACDTRITVAVPSCSFCTFQGSLGSVNHCHCNYVPGILRLGEMYDVAGLIAPRPFCAIAGKGDGYFPLEHVEIAFKRLKHIYTVAGAGDNCQLYVGDRGHRYYRGGAWPFINKHFAIKSSTSVQD